MVKKVAYILDIFPTVSETFIINEIVTVEKLGLETVIFSRKKPAGEIPHEEADRLARRTVYFPDPKNITFIQSCRDHLRLLRKAPSRYIKMFLFAARNNKGGLLWFFRIAGSYALLIEKHKPDHIHAHFVSLAGEYAMLVSMLLDIPYTFTAHGWHDIFEYPPHNFHQRGIRAKKVITVSQYNKDYMVQKFDIPAEKISVIHCGIRPELFTADGRTAGPELRILSIARLHPIKGVEYLVRACKLLKEWENRFTCHIIGDGELRVKIAELIDKLDMKQEIVFHGAQPAGEVRRQLALANVYVNSSLCEGLSVSIMEAMAARLPVIATRVTGVAELIEDNVNGYLVEPKDETELAAALQKMILDTDKRKKMGEISRRRIETDFALEAEVKKLIHEWNHA
ncbi:MAG: glycosyltransferase family 4 protein [Candidatus Omnitrophica bacterium]|nr:glycosyltransferase family 4 protein [Candidatus Omnitrophota bacterium]